ncbi:MAG: hypothetical protein N4J56_001991 [Chroococcidiopsis sp. SAG 2025]|nr:AIM24 family protein [Chroococcidiopsis sp. SAG 2025]MDV2992337.1 hypothetical protein [Chroococcidiopsis sp. SAG 2025]
MSITYKIEHSPAYASLQLDLKANETVLVESGAMAAMDSWIKMKSKMKGGVMKGIGRMVGGESLFMSEFTAEGRAGQLFLSPGVPGDIQHYYLDGNGLMLNTVHLRLRCAEDKENRRIGSGGGGSMSWLF